MLAIKLGSEIIQPVPLPGYTSDLTLAVCRPCGCLGGDRAAELRCRAEQIEREREEAEARNAKVAEYQKIARMCLPEKKISFRAGDPDSRVIYLPAPIEREIWIWDGPAVTVGPEELK